MANASRDPNPARKNIYICDTCGHHIVTKDLVEGTTPFMISCQRADKCLGKMASSFYRVFDPEDKMAHSHEWYKPHILLANMTPAVIDHVQRGGLLLRPVGGGTQLGAYTHRHKKRGTIYRIVGEVRIQISSDAIAGKWASELDGMIFTLYQGEDGVYNGRHPDEFNDGRFEKI